MEYYPYGTLDNLIVEKRGFEPPPAAAAAPAHVASDD